MKLEDIPKEALESGRRFTMITEMGSFYHGTTKSPAIGGGDEGRTHRNKEVVWIRTK